MALSIRRGAVVRDCGARPAVGTGKTIRTRAKLARRMPDNNKLDRSAPPAADGIGKHELVIEQEIRRHDPQRRGKASPSVCAALTSAPALAQAAAERVARAQRLERVRRGRPAGMLHRVAADQQRGHSATARPCEVNRGDIRLFVAVQPERERQQRGQLHRRLSAARGHAGRGRPRLRDASSSTRAPATPTAGPGRPREDDARMVAAMRRGSTATRDRRLDARHDHGRHLLAVGLHRRGRRGREPLQVAGRGADWRRRPGSPR